MRVFPFVIHSHDCAFYGIVLHNKKTKQKAIPTSWNFHISGSTSHKQLLRMGKHVVIGVLICNDIYFDVRDKNSACKQT